MPVIDASGLAAASSNTSDPVPQPRSRMRMPGRAGTCPRTMSRIRADRSAGALHVLFANGSCAVPVTPRPPLWQTPTRPRTRTSPDVRPDTRESAGRWRAYPDCR